MKISFFNTESSCRFAVPNLHISFANTKKQSLFTYHKGIVLNSFFRKVDCGFGDFRGLYPLCIILTYFLMPNPENNVNMPNDSTHLTTSAHDTGTYSQQVIDGLLDHLSETKRKFELEMNIKNNLYLFILEQGLFDELRQFSSTRKMTSAKGHQDTITHLLLKNTI